MDESCDESVSFRNVSVLYVYQLSLLLCNCEDFLKTFNINQLQEACVVTLYIHYIITTVLYLYYPFLIFNVMELKNEEKTTRPTWCILPPKHLIQGKVVHFVVNYLYYILHYPHCIHTALTTSR